MTLPDPLRGYAAPTWDTRTLASLIAALGGVGAAALSQAVADGRYAPIQAGGYTPSTGVNWIDVDNGTGSGSIQSLANTTATVLNVAGNVWSNIGGGFDAATDLYTVPVGGVYFCRAQMRVVDGFGTSCNIALGISQGSNDISGSWVMWNKFTSGGGSRCSLDTTRIFGVPAGGTIRAYAWQDSGFAMTLTAAALQAWRIGG